MSDRVLGVALLVASTAGFAYYTVWTLALPFVDADQPLHRLFPPRHWAVALPAYAIAVRPAFCVAHCVRCGALRRAWAAGGGVAGGGVRGEGHAAAGAQKAGAQGATQPCSLLDSHGDRYLRAGMKYTR
jgi:dolichyl-phosphate mannosyltransferase polypeptide 2 regulatory subunit